jgi:hypothetical protein
VSSRRNVAWGPPAECRGRLALTAFAPALPSPLRKTAPYGRPVHRLGDCAGRSPGSRVVALVVRPSQFPSGRVGPKARRSQLRGQPRMTSNSNARICRVRVPSFLPDMSRGTSTAKCSLETLTRVKRRLRWPGRPPPFTILLFPRSRGLGVNRGLFFPYGRLYRIVPWSRSLPGELPP